MSPLLLSSGWGVAAAVFQSLASATSLAFYHIARCCHVYSRIDPWLLHTILNQNKPEIRPFSSTSIFSADGTAGNPGIVITSPVKATIKPAPADTFRLRTDILKFSGAPVFDASSVNEYCVLAIQTGNPPKPCSFICFSCFTAEPVKSTPSAWYIRLAIDPIFCSTVVSIS